MVRIQQRGAPNVTCEHAPHRARTMVKSIELVTGGRVAASDSTLALPMSGKEGQLMPACPARDWGYRA